MTSGVNNVLTRIGFAKFEREWSEQCSGLAVSDEPIARAVVAVTAVVDAVAVAPSSCDGTLVVGSAALLTIAFETSMLEVVATVAMPSRRPCGLSQFRDVDGIFAIWTPRCCHACVVGCNVGLRAILPDAIRVGIAGRFCLGSDPLRQ